MADTLLESVSACHSTFLTFDLVWMLGPEKSRNRFLLTIGRTEMIFDSFDSYYQCLCGWEIRLALGGPEIG